MRFVIFIVLALLLGVGNVLLLSEGTKPFGYVVMALFAAITISLIIKLVFSNKKTPDPEWDDK